MTITKKDAEELAAALRETGRYKGIRTSETTRTLIAERIADAAKKGNPRFNKRKFLEACGLWRKKKSDED